MEMGKGSYTNLKKECNTWKKPLPNPKSNDSKLPLYQTLRERNLTLPYRASLSLVRRGKDFSAAKSEGEVLSGGL
ncbi:hypothetical protein DP113_13400 [Brasilonema octagenarum UFV-E1]|uniref:Uncharacterized protein n=3 Tax=Brasilonema TaxID=383614 RepID=A0A856MEM1_9CYAN|nr:hypothetical protein [Brasilonema octagenarum UFV-OR1]QDL08764.1 hypothetical protein DP114_13455 [Brasilonema sennae CENA114]QDL15122.1 hypothetical protein DP113_13400 [Brasilonema octagenarum UFV-E1]